MCNIRVTGYTHAVFTKDSIYEFSDVNERCANFCTQYLLNVVIAFMVVWIKVNDFRTTLSKIRTEI